MTVYYLDEMGGNNANNGASFANRWRTITAGAIAANIAPGDTIRIMKSPDPVSIGNATWTNGSPVITLARSCTYTIDNCDYPWTAAANVTTAVNTTVQREGYGCNVFTIAGAFGTGIVGYRATGTIDLSSYQQVSFWFRCSAVMAEGVFAIHLCSDTSGATPVNKIDIPNYPTANVWQIVTVPVMGNLSNSIQSIALFANSDPGAVNPVLDHIIACKSPQFTTIDNCDAGWTGGTVNVTATTDTSNHREGTGCASLAIAGGFTTGLVGYRATGTLDLSAYQEVWLKIRTSLAISTVNYLNITLCSDTAGATPVNTFNIRALPTVNVWYTLQLSGGGNLGNSIKSVAINSTNDFGAATLLIDGIIAVKTNSFTEIDDADNAWTASANVTATTDTSNKKEGTGCASLAIADGFSTGLIAYKATGTLNLSTYQQVSFWIRSNVAIPASKLTLTLCSDNAGATPVNTFAIPAITNTNTWTEFSIDAAGNMGASIASVALNAVSDPGVATILIDYIRTNDYVLTLSSLISKNITDECWMGILSINDTTVMIDNGGSNLPQTTKGYIGKTETTTTYKRECLKPSTLPAVSGGWETTQDTGTDGSPITFSGGWDTTDMSTQTGDTFFDGQAFTGTGIVSAGRNFITVEKLHFVRFAQGFNPTTGSFLTITGDMYLSNCSSSCFVSTSPSMTIGNLYCFGATTYGASLTSCHNTFINKLVTHSNGSSGLYLAGVNGLKIKTKFFSCNNTNGIQFNPAYDCYIYNATIANNTTAGINCVGTNNYFINCEVDNATDVSYGLWTKGFVYLQKVDRINNYHQIYSDGVIISAKTALERNTATGFCWEIAAINATKTFNNPILFKIATVACAANVQRTLTAYIKRNTTLATAQLFIPRNQATGLTTDLSTTATGALGVYQQETINFQPTADGVVDVYIKAYAFVPFIVYVDDIVGS